MDNIIVTDNDIQHAERGGAICLSGGSQRAKGAAYGQLKHVEVLRNRVVDTGFRHGYSPWSSIPAIAVSLPETCEIAGNIVDTSLGNGIITFGGKGSGSCNVVPLTRMLVHHNQIDNTMLGCNDYGGLEHFQGGPDLHLQQHHPQLRRQPDLGRRTRLQPLSRRRLQVLLLQQHHRRQGEARPARLLQQLRLFHGLRLHGPALQQHDLSFR